MFLHTAWVTVVSVLLRHFSLSCVCLVWTGITISLPGLLMDVPGTGASMDSTPSPDRDELMCCKSTPCGNLEGMKERLSVSNKQQYLLILSGCWRHSLRCLLSVLTLVFCLYLISCVKLVYIFSDNLLIFTSEASWNWSMFILLLLMISLKWKTP